jgi:prophage regulatory protein
MELTRKSDETTILRCRTSRSAAKEASSVSVAEGDLSAPPGPIRILRLGQVKQMTGLGKTKIYELQAREDFPRRVPLTGHAVGWIEAEIQTWLQRRAAARDAAVPINR